MKIDRQRALSREIDTQLFDKAEGRERRCLGLEFGQRGFVGFQMNNFLTLSVFQSITSGRRLSHFSVEESSSKMKSDAEI